MSRPLLIQHQGLPLSGVVTVPAQARHVVLIAHHGAAGDQKPRNKYLAKCLARSGAAVVQINLLTPAEEAENVVAGLFQDDPYLLAVRIVTVCRWIGNAPDLADLGIGCLGFGVGGAAVLMAAAARADMIDAVVVADGQPDRAGEALPRVAASTLLIASESHDVHQRMNEIAFTQLRCDKELGFVSGAASLANGEAFEEIAQLAAAWFRRHLHPRGIFMRQTAAVCA